MTNREWLLEQMQNMSDEELEDTIEIRNRFIDCENTYCKNVTCDKCIVKWLKKEHKEQIKLSDAERVILENIDKEFKWITREIDDRLHIHKNKPEKRNYWCSEWSSKTSLKMFKQLFQFITWDDSEPYNIEELLKGK